MAKIKKEKKHRWWPFFLFMFLYAAAFLTASYFGLKEFWAYMEAYENSRPKNTVNAYMDQLTVEYVADQVQDEIIARIDTNIQSEEECRAYILNQLSGGISHAKKSAESTDTRTVYVLRSGGKVVGQFAIESTTADEYGFTYWKLAEESFDMSYLVTGETISVTAPSEYTVSVNGVQLDETYVTKSGIHYELLEEYYDDFDLPTMSTYEAGPFLGEFRMEVTDTEGNPVVIDENTDMNSFVKTCSEAEMDELEEFIPEYLDKYVAFTGSANRARHDNLKALLEYVVEDSTFAQRMSDAVEGLYYAQSQGDEVTSVELHSVLKLKDGMYMCDVTYLVDTTGREGVVEVTNDVKITILETDDGLKVESMVGY